MKCKKNNWYVVSGFIVRGMHTSFKSNRSSKSKNEKEKDGMREHEEIESDEHEHSGDDMQ